jgi:hypothetical protein
MNTVATILAILQAAQQASAVYVEIKDTLSSNDKASIDAEIAKLAPQEIADEKQAEADLGQAAVS